MTAYRSKSDNSRTPEQPCDTPSRKHDPCERFRFSSALSKKDSSPTNSNDQKRHRGHQQQPSTSGASITGIQRSEEKPVESMPQPSAGTKLVLDSTVFLERTFVCMRESFSRELRSSSCLACRRTNNAAKVFISWFSIP